MWFYVKRSAIGTDFVASYQNGAKEQICRQLQNLRSALQNKSKEKIYLENNRFDIVPTCFFNLTK